MQRRQYLSLAVLSLAGCISDEGNTSTTPTKTEAQTTNPTPTQESESTTGKTSTTSTTSDPTPTQGPESTPEQTVEFEVESLDAPEEVEVGDEVQIQLTLRNVGTEPDTFESEISAQTPVRDWQSAGDVETETAEPGETVSWTSNPVSYDNEGAVEYRVEKLDLEFTIGVTPQTVQIEYTITAGKSPEAIPESIRAPVEDGGALEPGNQWVVVEFEVLEGTLDMQEIWFRSRIETETRFYDLDHATDKLADGVQSRGGIKAGGRAITLYQIPEDVTAYEWNLDETHARIEAIKK